MWRFRVHRPILFALVITDALLVVSLWLTELAGVELNKWLVTMITSWLVAHLVIIWRDGVS